MKGHPQIACAFVSFALLVSSSHVANAQVEWKPPAQGGRTFGVANLTQDYTVRDWGNYHNAQNWSYQGRYLAYTRYAADDRRFGNAPEVHVIDLHTGQDQRIDGGANPRWAQQHDWLFYTKEGDDAEVWWFDAEMGSKQLLGTGMSGLGGVSWDDKWLLGGFRFPEGTIPRSRSMRMRIVPNSHAEPLPGVDTGSQWIPNPTHDVVFARVSDRDDQPFVATRYWYHTDASDVQIGSISLTRCHQSWTGDGEYFLLGNCQVRGRKWNQPFPSSLHFLATVGTGDVSPCGRSGRFVVGDKPLTIADLRSGDGWSFLEDLSIICFPDTVSDSSGPYDSDMKGSPDGTKVNFVSNYDLIDGPVTFITSTGGDTTTRLEVDSTEMFPDSGSLVVNREVIGYKRKTSNSFEGLTRTLHFTLQSGLSSGDPVTLFEARTIPEEEWKQLPLPISSVANPVGDMESPLMRQKSTDLWAAVVRLPDRPWLRQMGDVVELIPGESHYETYGYIVQCDGTPLQSEPFRPGDAIRDLQPGNYTAIAVEWCGLESPPSAKLTVNEQSVLRILGDQPSDFSWTQDVWLVDGKPVDNATGLSVVKAMKATRHRYDGVIAREGYSWGDKQWRRDLNEKGLAIRRLTFRQDKLFRREYHNADEQHVSTEYLDPQGNVAEMIRYQYVGTEGATENDLGRYGVGPADGIQAEYDHWWYDNGMPVRRIGRKPARRIDSDTPVMFFKAGNQWVKADYVGKLPLQNQNIGAGWSYDRQRAIEFQNRRSK